MYYPFPWNLTYKCEYEQFVGHETYWHPGGVRTAATSISKKIKFKTQTPQPSTGETTLYPIALSVSSITTNCVWEALGDRSKQHWYVSVDTVNLLVEDNHKPFQSTCQGSTDVTPPPALCHCRNYSRTFLFSQILIQALTDMDHCTCYEFNSGRCYVTKWSC